MFRDACTKARNFTIPVVVSIQTVGGECAAGIGTAIVINDEGWIVTAAHVLKQLSDASEAEQRTRAHEAQIATINNDSSLGAKELRRRLNAIGKPKKTDVNRWSAWFGHDGFAMGTGLALEQVDLAIAQLQNFDNKKFKEYPVFKEPSKNFDPGTSLCRMGFAFVDVKPVWDHVSSKFSLTENVPLPIFPTEGILSRMARLIVLDQNTRLPIQTPFPFSFIETSSAGILGQSGGPIFDSDGNIWGIQSSTTSYQLDLNTKVQQYYHVGVGVHAETVIGFLKQNNVKHQVSTG